MKFAILAFGLLCSLSFLEASTIHRREAEEEHDPCPDDCETSPLEISFVVDASASIWPANFTKGLWFMQNFLEGFNIRPDAVRVSVVTFGQRVYTEDAFNFGDHTDKEKLLEVIGDIPYRSGQSTETGAAINYMLDEQLPHARKGVRKVIIVLTDGNSQKTDVTKAAADRAAEEGLEVFAIGVGHAVSEEELRNIASDDSHEFVVDSYHMLDAIINRLHYETCGVPKEPEPIRQCESSPADVTFVIDSSQSIGQSNFTLGLEFIQEFLDNFEINPKQVRVAAVMFGEKVYEDSAIHFDEYKVKKDTLAALMDLKWMHGTRTETGAGIDYMVEKFLPKTRPEAAHIGIVITDGKSQRWKYTEEAAARAREAGVIMFAVGVGRTGPGGSLDETELNNIAGDHERVILAEDYSKLNEIKKDLMHLTCTGIAFSLDAKEKVE